MQVDRTGLNHLFGSATQEMACRWVRKGCIIVYGIVLLDSHPLQLLPRERADDRRSCVSTAMVKTAHLSCVFTSFAAKILPLPCIFAAFVAKTVPLPCVSSETLPPRGQRWPGYHAALPVSHIQPTSTRVE